MTISYESASCEPGAGYETMPIGELIHISDPEGLIYEAAIVGEDYTNLDLLFRRPRVLSAKMESNYLLQLAKYKLLKNSDPLAKEIPNIVNCETAEEFIATFYGIGNCLVPPEERRTRCSYRPTEINGSRFTNIYNHIKSDELYKASIAALVSRENMADYPTYSRFYLFNALANISLANIKYERDDEKCHRKSTAGYPIKPDIETIAPQLVKFKNYQDFLYIVRSYLNLQLASEIPVLEDSQHSIAIEA